MVTTPNIGYQPAVMLQGEAHVDNNTTRQEPKTNLTQPKQAAPADSQSFDETSFKKSGYDEESTEKTPDNEATEKTGDKGTKLDITV